MPHHDGQQGGGGGWGGEQEGNRGELGSWGSKGRDGKVRNRKGRVLDGKETREERVGEGGGDPRYM